MPIINHEDAHKEEGYPGVERMVLVNESQGAQSLWVGHLTLEPGSRVFTHFHPNTEEAMLIVEGNLETILGDEVTTLGPGDTVLAPAGVKHGFVNRSSAPARLMAMFPTTHFQRVPVDYP